MKKIGIGLIGSGYMGKRHAVALHSVGAVFNTKLRPVCEMICTTSIEGAKKSALELGFNSYTNNINELINNPKIKAIIIASPQNTHKDIALAAFKAGKAILCEKPLGASLEDATLMNNRAKELNIVNMIGFNYIRTPVTQYAKQLISNGELGKILYVRAEHCEDFFSDSKNKSTWRTKGKENGTMGDLAPHLINAMHYLLGPIDELCSQIDIKREKEKSQKECDNNLNDDQAQFICTFKNKAKGHFSISRVAAGRKMGLTYEITGTKGSLRFDQEDQNAIYLYKMNEKEEGFKKILAGPQHPDFGMFCEGPGHGTGYQDLLIIQARDFLEAIDTKKTTLPTFEEGLRVSKVIDAVWRSHEQKAWTKVN
jgi:predicted dehydrogenase